MATGRGNQIGITTFLPYESSLIFLLRAHALFSLLHSSPQAAQRRFCPVSTGRYRACRARTENGSEPLAANCQKKQEKLNRRDEKSGMTHVGEAALCERIFISPLTSRQFASVL